MRERNNEQRKLEGKRQKQIAKTEGKVRLKKKTKTSVSLTGQVEQSESKKSRKVETSPWLWTDSLKGKSVLFAETEETTRCFL